MKRVDYYVGIDISADTFTVSFYQEDQEATPSRTYPSSIEGFEESEKWFHTQGITLENSVFCMENTGVYHESLCYYFHRKGFQLSVEAPHKAKRTFDSESKTDDIDAQQLAEYAYRFFDKLSWWQPQTEIVAQVETLLGLREQFSKQLTADKNTHKAYRRKVVKTPMALEMLEANTKALTRQIQQIDQELKRLLNYDDKIRSKVKLVKTIKGVGLLLMANLFVFTNGFQDPFNSKKMAARLGISPNSFQSETSVKKKDASRQQGNSRIRKLLYLAAMSLKTHSPKFNKYYQRKFDEGKPGKLILNNIENKLLHIIGAVLRDDKPFDTDHHSINPTSL